MILFPLGIHVLSALGTFIEAGKVIYDLENKLYRIRELSREPLPMDQLKFKNEREESAFSFVQNNQVSNVKFEREDSKVKITGKVGRYEPSITLNNDNQVIEGSCKCSFYYNNKMYKGPCEHMIALRYKSSKM